MDGARISGLDDAATLSAKKEDVQAPTPRSAAQERKLRQACRDFESIFLFNLFKEMRRAIPKSGLLPPSPGKETFQMMFDQKVAEDLSKQGEGIGLQKLLYEQLRRR
jgi:peptidoglycan hydrolase FlgJ